MHAKIVTPFAFTLFVVGCAANPNSNQAQQCAGGLSTAYQELDYADTNGFSGTVEYTKAASLLGAAKIQQGFGKYPNCIDKAQRAGAYIKASQR